VKKQTDYKVQIKMGDAEVSVEGAESGVVKIVEALSDVLRSSRKPSVSGGTTVSSLPSTSPALPSPRSAPADIRSFFEQKQPSSDIEAAAAAAYYSQYLAPEDSRRETIDASYLKEAFRQANRPLPARTSYTLINARNAGYLDSVGDGGQFRLNAVGYNLVEHGLGRSGEDKKHRLKLKRKRRKAAANKK